MFCSEPLGSHVNIHWLQCCRLGLLCALLRPVACPLDEAPQVCHIVSSRPFPCPSCSASSPFWDLRPVHVAKQPESCSWAPDVPQGLIVPLCNEPPCICGPSRMGLADDLNEALSVALMDGVSLFDDLPGTNWKLFSQMVFRLRFVPLLFCGYDGSDGIRATPAIGEPSAIYCGLLRIHLPDLVLCPRCKSTSRWL